MNRLARVDLDRFRIDSESFLGQAIALGVRFEKLPGDAPEAMLAYLQMAGMTFAQRYRVGIGISRDRFEWGVRQALVCMELGLEDRAGGDLNAAVDLLAGGDFEVFRERGWEIAFFRLAEMRETSASLLKRPEAAFLQRHLKDVGRWARLTPETWTMPPGADGEEEERVDPLKDYAAFREVKARVDFLRSLPQAAFRELGRTAGGGAAFEDLLRNLILSLALDLETLTPGAAQAAEFRSRCFQGGAMRPQARERVLRLVEDHLRSAVDDAAARAQMRDEVAAELSVLEEASEAGMEAFFILAEDAREP